MKTLIEYANELKENGFDIYLPNTKKQTYFFFVKNNNIGYVERKEESFNFSSVHKPNRISGTGYMIHEEIIEPNIKIAEDCFITKPFWANSRNTPIKYKSWEDYYSMEMNRIIPKVKL